MVVSRESKSGSSSDDGGRVVRTGRLNSLDTQTGRAGSKVGYRLPAAEVEADF